MNKFVTTGLLAAMFFLGGCEDISISIQTPDSTPIPISTPNVDCNNLSYPKNLRMESDGRFHDLPRPLTLEQRLKGVSPYPGLEEVYDVLHDHYIPEGSGCIFAIYSLGENWYLVRPDTNYGRR